MPNPVIEQIILPSGTKYDLNDPRVSGLEARIEQLESFSDFIGVIDGDVTPIQDGSTTTDVAIVGRTNPADRKTAVAGSIAILGGKEFIFNGTSWAEFGDLTALEDTLGDFAYVDTGDVQVSYVKPTGTITGSAETVTGSVTYTGKFTPTGAITSADATATTANYTPDGDLSSSTVTIEPKKEDITVVSQTGSLPQVSTSPLFSASVSEKVLTLGWRDMVFNPGTKVQTATKSVMTGVTSATAAAQTFTGKPTKLEFVGTNNQSVSVGGTAVTGVNAGSLAVQTTTANATGTATPHTGS